MGMRLWGGRLWGLRWGEDEGFGVGFLVWGGCWERGFRGFEYLIRRVCASEE